MNLFLVRNIALGLILGGTLGFLWYKLVGCTSGACPLTATPLRAITVGALFGLIFSSTPTHSQPRSTMPSSAVLNLSGPAFDKTIAQEKPVLIDFWAPWCGPCRMQGPILDQVSAKVGDKAVIVKVNVDEEPALAGKYGVQAIPTLLLMKQGKVIQRMQGVQSAEALTKMIEAAQ